MFQPGKWVSPATVKQAVKCLSDHGKSALVYGGGTHIYELARKGFLDRVRVVVDQKALRLAYVKGLRGKLTIGAGTTMTILQNSSLLKSPGFMVPYGVVSLGKKNGH